MTKRVAVLCVLFAALTCDVASAASGVNLRWNECFDDGGLQNESFACDINTGVRELVGSFELGADLSQVSNLEIVLDLATAGSTLPARWQFKNVGTCRTTSLRVSGVISATAVACTDWSAGAAAGGLAAYNPGLLGPTTARIVAGFFISQPLVDLVAGQEYFAFNALIDNQKTLGDGACGGCTTPACIVCSRIQVGTPPDAGQPSRDVTLTGPTNGMDGFYATWQGGAGVASLRGQGCPAATPTHATTWSPGEDALPLT
jgi:hypothetical protein